MGTSKTWPGGSTGATPAAYTIPAAGELNWAALSNFLAALADGAQSTTFQKYAVRKATTTPVTVSATTDCVVLSDLSVAGAVTVNLPAGANKQVFIISDGKGDAATNNITINRAGSDTIGGATSLVLNQNREGVILVYNSSDTDWKVLGRLAGSAYLANPMTTSNDIIVGGASGTPTRLAKGSNYQLLGVNSSGNVAYMGPDFGAQNVTTTGTITPGGGTVGRVSAVAVTSGNVGEVQQFPYSSGGTSQTTTAGTAVDVLTFAVPAGVWLLSVDFSVFTNINASGSGAYFSTLLLTDNTPTTLARSSSSLTATTAASHGAMNHHHMTHPINISASTTYRIRLMSNASSAGTGGYAAVGFNGSNWTTNAPIVALVTATRIA